MTLLCDTSWIFQNATYFGIVHSLLLPWSGNWNIISCEEFLDFKISSRIHRNKKQCSGYFSEVKGQPLWMEVHLVNVCWTNMSVCMVFVGLKKHACLCFSVRLLEVLSTVRVLVHIIGGSSYVALWVFSLFLVVMNFNWHCFYNNGFNNMCVNVITMSYPGSEMIWLDHQCRNKVDNWANRSTFPHRRSTPLTGHICRLSTWDTPASQALHLSIDAFTGTPPATDWKRPLGRPRRTWLQQVEEDMGLPISAC